MTTQASSLLILRLLRVIERAETNPNRREDQCLGCGVIAGPCDSDCPVEEARAFITAVRPI